MRVVCKSTPDGNVYSFHRTNHLPNVPLRRVVQVLLAARADMLIDAEDCGGSLLLKAGPIGGEVERSLIELLGDHLVTRCAAV